MSEENEEIVSAKVKGGIARREALSPERRAEIARMAAMKRWDKSIPKATHEGELHIGDLTIPCAVLEDGTRVLSESGITYALLGSRSGASRRIRQKSLESGAPIPLFLAPSNLKPFIDAEFPDGPILPLIYEQGQRQVSGFVATILTSACNVWLKAREAGKLHRSQLDKAQKAEILMRALASVGIIALVDEATGYQYDRARTALVEILEEFVAKELRKWVKTFPDEFYQQICRLRGWKLVDINKRGSIFGRLTNNLIYRRLAPGVLKELQRITPKDSKGRRKHKYFQRLTEDIGHPRLRELLTSEIVLMRVFDNGEWDAFLKALNRAVPIYGNLPLFDDLDAMQEDPSMISI